MFYSTSNFIKNKFNILLVFFILMLNSCATYQGKVEKAKRFIVDKNWVQALKELEPLALQSSDDQLVYLLDYATTLQMSGNFKESNKYFIQADKLSDIKDYTSLSRETGAIVLNEEMVQYKGDDFEVILINAMTAVNFLALNDLDSALVEVRRLNEKLNRFRIEANRKFTDNAFALYLSGIIWESNQKWDDAFISYEAAYKLSPYNRQLQENLMRAAFKSKRTDQFQKLKKEITYFNDKEMQEIELANKNKGELIIIYESGWVPQKNFRRESYRYPQMYPISVVTQGLSYKITKQGATSLGSNFYQNQNYENSRAIFSVEQMAVQSLEDQYATLVARRFAGAVTKEIVSDQIRQKNELLGFIANIALHASDRADLRQWSTLPGEFHIIRIPLDAGTYNLNLSGLDYVQQTTGEYFNSEVEIKSGKKSFQFFRALK